MATANPDTSEVPNEGEKEGDTGAGSGGEGEGGESDRAFEVLRSGIMSHILLKM